MSNGYTYANCDRCGIRRQIDPRRESTGMCRDCWQTEPNWPNVTIEAPDCTLGRASPWGWILHWRAGETCEACSEAKREAERERYRRKHGAKPREVAKCGTDSGYTRHRRLGEFACQPCVDAHRAANPYRKKVA